MNHIAHAPSLRMTSPGTSELSSFQGQHNNSPRGDSYRDLEILYYYVQIGLKKLRYGESPKSDTAIEGFGITLTQPSHPNPSDPTRSHPNLKKKLLSVLSVLFLTGFVAARIDISITEHSDQDDIEVNYNDYREQQGRELDGWGNKDKEPSASGRFQDTRGIYFRSGFTASRGGSDKWYTRSHEKQQKRFGGCFVGKWGVGDARGKNWIFGY
ncbi:hypothetical protein P167DRAFT_547021 [Morchella conica CCBAS932]|uniref:Uncharacterized protein n=1 Tax=Morchella conica CCBAS932 TaxID=1392247 RepID=A0A3N4KJL4_9PEZI|nr:hypothetical protein P167DRAFT_547021 [Morchella conica CCBAS932]